MRITFVFGGGKNEPEAAPLIDYYGDKIKRMKEAEILNVISREKTAEKIRKEEGRKIGDLIKPGDYLILFDERGRESSSEEYAALIEKTEASHKRIFIAVGGAYGVSDEIRKLADKIISFSPMIFPHQVARIMALEQTYRAISIIRGSKYHHG